MRMKRRKNAHNNVNDAVDKENVEDKACEEEIN